MAALLCWICIFSEDSYFSPTPPEERLWINEWHWPNCSTRRGKYCSPSGAGSRGPIGKLSPFGGGWSLATQHRSQEIRQLPGLGFKTLPQPGWPLGAMRPAMYPANTCRCSGFGKIMWGTSPPVSGFPLPLIPRVELGVNAGFEQKLTPLFLRQPTVSQSGQDRRGGQVSGSTTVIRPS